MQYKTSSAMSREDFRKHELLQEVARRGIKVREELFEDRDDKFIF